MSNKCERCDGRGQIASGEKGAPCMVWQSIPPVRVVCPIPCPDCGGTGRKKQEDEDESQRFP